MFEILSNMHNNQEPIDMVTVCGRLTEKDKSNGVDAYFVTGLLGNPTSNHSYYAKQVYEKYLLRQVIKIIAKCVEERSPGTKDQEQDQTRPHQTTPNPAKPRQPRPSQARPGQARPEEQTRPSQDLGRCQPKFSKVLVFLGIRW